MATMYIRAPDHLGDGVMALPAITALKKLGPVSIEGPAWVEALYGSRSTGKPQGDVAVLFKPSFSAAWRARRCTRRIGLLWDHRGPLLTDPVQMGPGHRLEDYATIAAFAGAVVNGAPEYTESLPPTADLPDDFTLLLPLSKSLETVGWRQYRDLADALGSPVILAAGPGEDAALAEIAGPHHVLPALSLQAFAGVARRARAVVGNDSGLSHLAAAAVRGAGQDPSKVHVIYGSTDPSHTGPPGTHTHRQPGLACWPCYKKRCRVSSTAPCLEVPIQAVLDALAAS